MLRAGCCAGCLVRCRVPGAGYGVPGAVSGAGCGVRGAFAEAKELVAGFWLLHVPSMKDAIEWLPEARGRRGPGNSPSLRPLPVD